MSTKKKGGDFADVFQYPHLNFNKTFKPLDINLDTSKSSFALANRNQGGGKKAKKGGISMARLEDIYNVKDLNYSTDYYKPLDLSSIEKDNTRSSFAKSRTLGGNINAILKKSYKQYKSLNKNKKRGGFDSSRDNLYDLKFYLNDLAYKTPFSYETPQKIYKIEQSNLTS